MRSGNRSIIALATVLSLGCKEKAPKALAPAASALTATPAPTSATKFRVDSATSKVTFLMDSPLEKIDGDASGGLRGELYVDPSDVTRSTGLVEADLQKLVLYQQKRGDDKANYGERSKSDLQNTHARNWLQIVPVEGEVTPEQAAANRFAQFKVDKLEAASLRDVTTAPGPERRFTANAHGELRLHGRKQSKDVKLEITIRYEGNTPRSLHVKSLEPIPVGLAEFEVNPRDNAGKFVKSVTDALSSNLKGKVAEDAPLTIDFNASAE